VYPIVRFVEKPDAATAAAYVSSGEFYWNSGMFMFRASVYLAELGRHAPAMLEACTQAYAGARRDLDFTRLAREAFESCPSDSIDYAVMERTRDGVVLPLAAGWSDVGSWSALRDALPADADGNVIAGDVIAEDTSGCYLQSTSRLIGAVGLRDHVVVETKDAVLVAPRDRVQDVKQLVARLKAQGRYETSLHREVFRPGAVTTASTRGSLPGQEAGRQARRLDVAAAASSSRRALDRRLGHRAYHARRRGVPARRERIDVHPGRDEAPHREPRDDPAAHHRGAVGHLPG
jgi:mannose-1-phosphate guanylyltransferase/mannose-6-phosphate isomerase